MSRRGGVVGDAVSVVYAVVGLLVVVALLFACVTRWVTDQPCPPAPIEDVQLPTLGGVS